MTPYNHETFMDNIAEDARTIHDSLKNEDEKNPPIYQAVDVMFRAFELGHAIVGNLNMLVAIGKRRLEIDEAIAARETAAFANHMEEEIKRRVEKELAKPKERSYIGAGRTTNIVPNNNEEET